MSSQNQTKEMPHNLQAEQALLGAILTNNDAMHHCGMELQPAHFYDQFHQRVYAHLQEGIRAGRVVNPITLRHLFEAESVPFENTYLARLVVSSTAVVNVAEYARVIRGLAMVRLLHVSAQKVLDAPAGTSSEQLVTVLAQAVIDVQKNSTHTQAMSAGLVSEMVLADIRSNLHPTSTGIPRLDAMLQGGLYPGKMYGIGARKKTGKTTLLGTLSYNLNHSLVPLQENQSGKHLFICGEMGAKEIHTRQLARELEVEPSAFLKGGSRPHDFEQRLQWAATNGPRNALYMDAPGLTLDGLKQMVAVAVAKHKIDGFILDYWQLVGGAKPGQKTEHLDEVAQWIAQACKQYGIWAVVSAQINREGAFRGGDGLQNAADLVMVLEREDPTKIEAWLTITDSRYTPYGTLGTKNNPGLVMQPQGPYFEERQPDSYLPPSTPIEAYAERHHEEEEPY